MAKYKNNKTRSTKKYAMTAKQVAEIARCSESYVKQLRTGSLPAITPKAMLVMEIDKVAEEGNNVMIQEIGRIVKN